jgi:hypothetical protein
MQGVEAPSLTHSDGESDVEEEVVEAEVVEEKKADYEDFAPDESSPEDHGFIWQILIDSVHDKIVPEDEDEAESDEER